MYQKTTLDNGIRIVTQTIPYVHSVTIGFWYKVGSRHETPEQQGISHVIEHMLFKGTASRSAQEIAEAVDATGGHLNAFTAREHTCFYGKVPSHHLALIVDLLADMLLNSRLDEVELEKEKRVILEEIKMYEDTPEELVHELLTHALLQPHPLSHSILGLRSTVSRLQRDDLLAYMARFYVPANLIVSAVGNVDHAQVVQEVEKHMGFLQGKRPQHKPAPAPQPQRNCHTDRETEQLHICLGVPGVSRRDEDKYTLFVLDTALGGSMSSRLLQRLREDEGLVYNTYSYYACYEDLGLLAIYAGTSPESAWQVIDLIRQECKKLAEKGLNPEELQRAKEQLKGSLLLGLESMSNRMNRLAEAELYEEKLLSPVELGARIDAVSIDDIKQLATRLFAEEAFVLATIGPTAENTSCREEEWVEAV